LSLCLTKHHAMKMYWGSGGIALCILDLGTRWRWVVSFTPRSLYSQGKSPRYPVARRLGGPPSRYGRGVNITTRRCDILALVFVLCAFVSSVGIVFLSVSPYVSMFNFRNYWMDFDKISCQMFYSRSCEANRVVIHIWSISYLPHMKYKQNIIDFLKNDSWEIRFLNL
jgi:hypothetical protein